MFILAISPILVILLLMVGFRWGASRAGGAGYLTALLVAWIWFGINPETLSYAHAKAVFLILDVLLIIWTAFLLFRVVDEAGGIKILSKSLPYLTADKGMQALIIGWIFASFLQGVGGFGVPVAVIAPILVGLGFTPLSAVIIPSLGHSWAVTFGSLGASFNAMMAATELDWQVLASPAAIFLGIIGICVGFAAAYAAGGWKTIRRLALPILIIGVVMSTAQYLTVTLGFWSIGGLIGGTTGLLIGIPLAWKYKGNGKSAGKLDWKPLLISLAGYGVLVVLTLLIQLVPPLNRFLSQVQFGFDFPATRTLTGYMVPAGPGRQITIFRHAGMILLVSSAAAYLIFKSAGWYKSGALSRILGSTGKRVISSSVGITSIVMMAVIMQHAGMTDTLARGFSSSLGWFYPALSPWIGALGAVMTGSNANSNLIFSLLQLRTAELLGLPAAIILAVQTTGGALGSVVAPTKIIVGASTAGLEGQEGDILRKLLPVICVLLLIVSIMAMIGVILR
ncbi:MAG: L-lactate permease [Anaerolineales bacterium]|nr:L-lactate permease [Anaerolineales bacterium]